MFKSRKRNPKTKGALRRKQEDDTADEEKGTSKPGDDNKDNDDDDNDETAANIARVKKKRKLLTELQYKKGTDTSMLLKGRSAHDHDGSDNFDDKHIHTLAAEAIASSSQEGVMEQKHKQALEQYVEAKLADMVGGDAKAAVANALAKVKSSNSNSDTTGMTNDSGKLLTKEELYRQLAEASEALVGRKKSTEGGAHADGGEDGDVGTGGAMLVAGTGLAEVILPVEERLKAVHATQEANSVAVGPQSQQQRHNMNYGMPKSQVPIPSGTSRFQVSAANRHFAPGGGRGPNNNNGPGAPQASSTEQPSNEVDQGRMGFDAARGKVTAVSDNNSSNSNNNYKNNNSNSNNQQGGNNNNSTSRKDYKNKASDDKVYGNFLKHHRENQWRGR